MLTKYLNKRLERDDENSSTDENSLLMLALGEKVVLYDSHLPQLSVLKRM